MKTADPSSHSSGDAASYYGHSAQASKPTPVFLFMGKTGAGKSTMIKLLGGKNIDGAGPIVDGGIESCTFKSCPYSTEIDNNKVILLDTPGFDDSARDNLQILREIASHLRVYSLRESEFEIRGIVFLHDIGETRLGGSQRKTWQILKEICGGAAMSNVLVGTTMWGPQGSKKFLSQEAREKELKGKHWNGIYKSTRVVYDDQDNATQIIKDLLARPSVLLLVQKEMLIPPHTVENTTAGRVAMPEGQAEKEQAQREYEEAQKKAEEEKRQHEEAFQRQQEEEKRKFEEEKKRKEEEERKRKEEEDRQRQKREQERREEEERQRRHYEEEQRRIKREAEERRRRAEEEEKRRRQEEERRRVDEMRKIQEEYRRREEEERRRAEEMRKIQEEYRRREERERRRREEERRRQEEEEWREELRRREEVERRRREEEERRRQEERHRQWEENRRREQEAQRERERWQRMIDEQNRVRTPR